MKQYEHVMLAFLAADGHTLTRAQLTSALEGKGVVLDRLSTYFWDAKNKVGAEITSVKEGKTVVAYHLKNADKFRNHEFGKKPEKTAQPKVRKEKPTVTAQAAMEREPEVLADSESHAVGGVDAGFDNTDISDVLNSL